MSNFDDALSLVMIDKERKCRISVELQDENGETVSLKDTISEVTKYVSDKLDPGNLENPLRSQIFPMFAQGIAHGLKKLIGEKWSSLLLMDETTRMSIVHMATVGFFMYRLIDKKGLKISTTEEPITDEDIDSMERISQATNLMVYGASMGLGSKEMIRAMLKLSVVQKEDLTKLGLTLDDLGISEEEIESFRVEAEKIKKENVN